MKTKAKDIAVRTVENVYYISLSAVTWWDNDFSVCHIPSIFDLSTEKQFSGTNVIFICAPTLKEMYEEETGTSNANAIELIQWLVAREPNANYFIDEYGVDPFHSE